MIILTGMMLVGCSSNLPNCSNDYIQVDESCVLKEVDVLYDYTVDNTTYELDIYVDDQERTMTVEGRLGYRNDKVDMDTIYLMIYPNANRYHGESNAVFEYVRVNREEVTFEYSDMDDEILEVTPNEIVEMGEFFEVEFKYTFHFWFDGRLSLLNEYMNAMFFYPIVAQYDGEFQLDQHSFMGEVLYTDIADFTVTLNLPKEYIIASGGQRIDTKETGDRKIETYQLFDARDYSFSASTDYLEYEREHNGITYTIYSRNEINSSGLDYHFGYMFDTFDYLEEHVGTYYYDYFKLELGEIYGMESSSIIYCSKDIGEITIIHEIVHQWFFFMVGNNQGDESWLDEGLTSYVTGIVFEEVFGEGPANEWYYPRYDAMNEGNLDRYHGSAGINVIQSVHDYVDYGYVVYRYGSTVIYEYVEQYMQGDHDAFFEVLKVYYNQYNGKNATIDEFISLIESETNIDETDMWFTTKLSSVQRLDE